MARKRAFIVSQARQIKRLRIAHFAACATVHNSVE